MHAFGPAVTKGFLLALLLSPSATAQERPRHVLAAGIAEATIRVLPSVVTTKQSDLQFGPATPGAMPQTIGIEQSEAAQVALQATRYRACTVQLPHEVRLWRLGNGAQSNYQAIRVRKFQATIQAKDDPTSSRLTIGATRDRIPPWLPAGDYAGTFTATVVY